MLHRWSSAPRALVALLVLSALAPIARAERNVHVDEIHSHGGIQVPLLRLGKYYDHGGQPVLVVGRAQALSAKGLTTRVICRQFTEAAWPGNSEPVEPLADQATIHRLPYGPPGYLFKDKLIPHLAEKAERLETLWQREGPPRIMLTNFFDAGVVGAVARRRFFDATGRYVPQLHQGHSLCAPKIRAEWQKVGEGKMTVEAFDHKIDELRLVARLELENWLYRNVDALLANSTDELTAHQYGDPAYGGLDTLPEITVAQPGVSTLFDPKRQLDRRDRAVWERFLAAIVDRAGQGDAEERAKLAAIIGTPRAILADHARKPKALFWSRVATKKGYDTALEGYLADTPEGRAWREAAHAVFVIPGGVNEKDREQGEVLQRMAGIIEAASQRPGFEPLQWVTIIPFDQEQPTLAAIARQLPEHYPGSVYGAPSLHEPFGQMMREMAWAGLPAVVSRTGGQVGFAEASGAASFVPTDTTDLARAFAAVQGNAERWPVYGQRQRVTVAGADTWDARIDPVIALLDQVIDQAGRKQVLPELKTAPDFLLAGTAGQLPGADKLARLMQLE